MSRPDPEPASAETSAPDAAVAPAWLSRVFDLAPAPVSVSRAADGRILEANEAYLHFFGFKREEVLGRTSVELDIMAADERQRIARLVSTLGSVRSLEAVVRVKGGERRNVLLSVEHVDGPDPCLLTILQDITSAKRAQEDLAFLADELKRSNAELEQFAYAASHDLQAPLRQIATLAHDILDANAASFDASTREDFDRLLRGAARMQDLVKNLLEYSRVERATRLFEPVDVGRVVDDVLAVLEPAIVASRAKVTRGALPAVVGDATQLRELVQNLVENALKFHAPGAPPEVHFAATRAGAEWTFSVRDNGIGVDPSQTERIFRMFTRLHPQGQYAGSGIGLALAKRIVENHGGRIWVESTPGEGATFRFTLPDPTPARP
jgi:PAS domain S-box-containing protein